MTRRAKHRQNGIIESSSHPRGKIRRGFFHAYGDCDDERIGIVSNDKPSLGSSKPDIWDTVRKDFLPVRIRGETRNRSANTEAGIPAENNAIFSRLKSKAMMNGDADQHKPAHGSK